MSHMSPLSWLLPLLDRFWWLTARCTEVSAQHYGADGSEPSRSATAAGLRGDGSAGTHRGQLPLLCGLQSAGLQHTHTFSEPFRWATASTWRQGWCLEWYSNDIDKNGVAKLGQDKYSHFGIWVTSHMFWWNILLDFAECWYPYQRPHLLPAHDLKTMKAYFWFVIIMQQYLFSVNPRLCWWFILRVVQSARAQPPWGHAPL